MFNRITPFFKCKIRRVKQKFPILFFGSLDGDFASHTPVSALRCGWFLSFTAWHKAMKVGSIDEQLLEISVNWERVFAFLVEVIEIFLTESEYTNYSGI